MQRCSFHFWHTTIFFAVLLITTSACKDPEEYNPQDPQIPPPDSPVLILPLTDTVICEGPILLDWTIPTGSQIYQIQTDTLYTFSTAEIVSANTPPFYTYLTYYPRRTAYYARVRAGSSHWIDYTAWSEIRRFYLWPEM